MKRMAADSCLLAWVTIMSNDERWAVMIKTNESQRPRRLDDDCEDAMNWMRGKATNQQWWQYGLGVFWIQIYSIHLIYGNLIRKNLDWWIGLNWNFKNPQSVDWIWVYFCKSGKVCKSAKKNENIYLIKRLSCKYDISTY